MSSLSAAELRERLRRDVPGALIDSAQPAASSDGDGTNGDGTRPRAAHAASPAAMLVTEDAVVVAARLPDVARYLRDELGYELLSNITAVDYLAEDIIELVYHFINIAGGAPLVLKTRVPRDNPVVPSLTPWWPGADLQEREAFDLFGVQFPGHPNLRRVYMWDEFEGFPMRKDFPRHGDKYMEDGE